MPVTFLFEWERCIGNQLINIKIFNASLGNRLPIAYTFIGYICILISS